MQLQTSVPVPLIALFSNFFPLWRSIRKEGGDYKINGFTTFLAWAPQIFDDDDDDTNYKVYNLNICLSWSKTKRFTTIHLVISLVFLFLVFLSHTFPREKFLVPH